MKKNDLKEKVIAVIRVKEELGWPIISKIIDNEIDIIEITYTMNNASKLIKKVKKYYPNTIVGAGTILNLEQAKEAHSINVDFIVSPIYIKEVADYCMENNIFLMQGGATLQELYKVHQNGSEICKMFPGNIVDKKTIKAAQSVFSNIDIMPTGGVNADNISEWFENGAYALGVGSYLSDGITINNLEQLTIRCQMINKALQDYHTRKSTL